LLIYKGELCYYYIRGVKEEECNKNKNYNKGSSKGSSKREGNKKEQDCFIDKDLSKRRQGRR
jgi:hypothetical protein